MNTLLQITEEDISRLNKGEFADLINRLLKAEAAKYGIPLDEVKTTLRIDEPDGGVDARVNAPATLQPTCRIPPGLSVWQFKSGEITPRDIDRKDKKNPGEARKLGVQLAVQQEGQYRLVVGHDYGDRERNRREAALAAVFGVRKSAKLLLAPEIASWATENPPIALQPYFKRPVHDGFMDFNGWKILDELRVRYLEYLPDQHRTEIIQEIGRSIQSKDKFLHLRLTGRAGVGKTRLALEAIRHYALEYKTLYALSPDDLPEQLFTYIGVNQGLEVVLVVDECDNAQAWRLSQYAQQCGAQLALITIGHDLKTETNLSPSTAFYLDKLDGETIAKIIQSAVKALPHELTRFVVRLSSGYVKMAIALAESLARNPGLVSAAELAALPDIRTILNRLIPDPITLSTMRALSLLNYVGWEGDVEGEGRRLMVFANVPWPQARHAVEQMRKQGLIVKRGRYRYVTPNILAVALATAEWQARSGDIVDELLLGDNRLPTPSSLRSLLERLADLGQETFALPLVEKLLSPDGLFSSVESLEQPVVSDLLGILSTISPSRGLATLERLLAHLPRDRLKQFTSGRQQVVWALEKMLWLPETYEEAARLLLSLAEAENAPYANNATGVWVGFFGTHLGGTAVSAKDRHRLIDEALGSPSLARRSLAVKAIRQALSIWETRGIGAEYQGGRVVPPAWRPKNLQEDQDVRLSALSLLDRALRDPDDSIRQEAKATLFQVWRGLLQFGLFDELISRIEELKYESEKDRIGAWEDIRGVLHFEKASLTEHQREHLEHLANTLAGDSFHDRLHRIVGKFSHVYQDRDETSDKNVQEMLASQLAEEGFYSPHLLMPELDWLASPDAQLVFFFARRLGELDKEHSWLAKIRARVNDANGATLLGAYLRGRADAEENEWVDNLLNEWADESDRLAISILETTWRLPATDRGAYRLVGLVDKGWLKPASLSILMWGRWAKTLSEDAFRALLERASLDQSAVGSEIALGLFVNWLEGHPNNQGAFAEMVWRLLERPNSVAGHGMLQFYWEQVAPLFIQQDPLRMALAILSAFENEENTIFKGDPQIRFLGIALRTRPDEVWDVVGKFLLRGDIAAFNLQLTLRKWGMHDVGASKLMTWAKQHEPDARYLLAELAGSEDVPLTPLGRTLLITYPDDDRIEKRLISTFLSGSWSGSMTSWLESKLEQAKELLNDSNATIRKWARELVTLIEEDIRTTSQREEEEDLRFSGG